MDDRAGIVERLHNSVTKSGGIDIASPDILFEAGAEIARLREERDAAEAFGSMLKTQRDDADKEVATLRARVEGLTAAIRRALSLYGQPGGEFAARVELENELATLSQSSESKPC